jgi:hypothetical protein
VIPVISAFFMKRLSDAFPGTVLSNFALSSRATKNDARLTATMERELLQMHRVK